MKNKKVSRREFIGKGLTFGAIVGLGTLLGEGVYELGKYFTREEWEKHAVNLSLRKNNSEILPNKKAILIEENYSRKDGIDIMAHLLKSYGYQCNTINPENATEDKIFSKIEQLATESNNSHQTVFYYAGHGHVINKYYGKAISVKGRGIDKSRITEYELFDALGKIQGKKAIIIDACHSGAFVDYLKDIEFQELALGYNIIDNYVAIASCPADCVSISSSKLIKDKRIGALTRGLYNLLNFTGSPVNLSTADIEIANKSHRKSIDKLAIEIEDPSLSFEMQRVSDTDFIL